MAAHTATHSNRQQKETLMNRLSVAIVVLLMTPSAWADTLTFTVFESAGADSAAITPTRDAFRAAVGGGTVAGANGSFGGLRREINWDGVPAASGDPHSLPANFFYTNLPPGI